MKNVKWEAVYAIHIIASGMSLFALLVSVNYFFLVFFLANICAGTLIAGIIFLDNEKK